MDSEQSLTPYRLGQLYETLKQEASLIDQSKLDVRQIMAKFLTARSDRKNCLIINEIAVAIIVHYYRNRHRNASNSELINAYSPEHLNNGVRYTLENLPMRLLLILKALTDHI